MTTSPALPKTKLSELSGWLLAFMIPAFLYVFLKQSTLNWASINFTVIFSAALIMWVFRLVPEYTPAVFIILSTILLGLAPQQVILSGYSSNSFFMALSIFGIGAVIVKSRLFYRLSLLTLKHLPQNRFLLQCILFLIGTVMTMVMTAQSSRTALISHLVEDIRKSAGFKPCQPAANALACAAYNGAILLSVIFLTGKSGNFVLYGMLSEQTQWQYSWLNWFLAAALPAGIMILIFFLLMQFFFRSKETVKVHTETLHEELSRLGSLSVYEWAAILSVFALLAGLFSSSWHQIPSAWLSFAIFFILLTSGILNKNDFKNGINWPFLFYLGAIIGIMRCVQEIGLDQWIMSNFQWVSQFAGDSPAKLITCIYTLSFLGALIFGTVAAPALIFSIFLPITQDTVLSSWLVAFTVLMATEAWIFPYQSSNFLCFEEQLTASKAYRLKPSLKINFIFVFIRLIAILLSIPLWKKMGVL